MSRAQRALLVPVLATLLSWAAPARAADVAVKLDTGSGFVIQNAAGSTERLRVHEATGNISRNGALFVHTTGSNNLFVVDGSGTLGTTGLLLNELQRQQRAIELLSGRLAELETQLEATPRVVR
jgi:hypothetical protein